MRWKLHKITIFGNRALSISCKTHSKIQESYANLPITKCTKNHNLLTGQQRQQKWCCHGGQNPNKSAKTSANSLKYWTQY